ncbi:TetR/AcrR family transcriptional regulator [Cellulomonas fimi]|uniref:Transcriptional regulator, TetR family n=1 Tax=Cellulomonas fimi (strain ATCC 484 / DSM 20113 / JCM 1341 / CCUG 24087 / LMG 16345 / NBRC 15513 / NCIMB 8980 / NCTC 7547 / NRS-133) TaxID=590998 RepID=F4H639_CELFA|nr:TetR/AcrR family transcriptional regulator [Cellulomonas fimi]AEE46769.1 transcriptional regulator, TetR family [Cellulomonas fimi ATCC 484]NNH08835.1 TetR/AcrR family transcriptional regulator [Cellulomonas fimi]VEH34130.1 HTH-type transcriptional repressor KstR2 [Cellulomonas fimi]
MKQTSVADDVLRAALGLFAAQGYANTSVQQVVEQAGVTKGAMYHYFQSKDDLLFAIYDRMLTLQTDHLDAIVARGEPIEVTLRAVCVDVIETSIDFLLEGTVFFRSVHMLSQPRQQEVTRRRRAYHDTFAGLVEKGQAEGLYRTDVPRGVLVAHFFADVHYLPTWFSPEGPETKEQVAAQLTELFLTGIAAGPGRG